ncbi:tetratricopeptide repeat protein [Flavobacterium sp. '19STA2R22 D10 B1']|uniref:tetratricopeptide repeat protein n=1 Tax=Flavobacterium aerium TaxID=3037261 RepID=UPI00278C1AF1|nr:hypothetical protein [Flavobacterium sp. '19STA2R22 D10 B1']
MQKVHQVYYYSSYQFLIPLVLLLNFGLVFSQTKTELDVDKKIRQDKIIKEFAENCAHKSHYFFPEWQECLDAGLKKDSTIAYLWQQKAMPYFKQRKYEVGMALIDKAVYYNNAEYLPYRAFIKCIFSKEYKDAIIDFKECIVKYGNQYEMDHTYNFYIALSYLQLNEFKKAEELFTHDILDQEKKRGEAHYLDVFYLGITKYEQKKWEEANQEFDKALSVYTNFSDAKYYKTLCLYKMGKMEESKVLSEQAKIDLAKGYTINEDNAIYELYPYQLKRTK